jgi:hypothetical protein
MPHQIRCGQLRGKEMNQNVFAAGDAVQCILGTAFHGSDYRYGLEENRIYDVCRVSGHYVYLHGQVEYPWYYDRFVFAGSPVANPADVLTAMNPTPPNVVKPPTTLPTDSNERKNYPLFRGCLRYFPAALAGVAKNSKLGNDKHNPGEEMHHARGKSSDHGDCIIRHLTDVEDLLAAYNRGDTTAIPQDILNEANQLAWRALAFSQELHEKFGAPLAPGAKK